MNILLLFKHYRLQQKRSAGYELKIAKKILLAILWLYLIAMCLLCGVMYNSIYAALSPEWHISRSAADVAIGILFYGMLYGLFMRMLSMNAGYVDILRYHTLPLPHHTINAYYILRSTTSIAGYFPLAFIIPVALQTIAPAYGPTAAGCYIACYIFMVWFNCILAAWTKLLFRNCLYPISIIGIIIISLLALSPIIDLPFRTHHLAIIINTWLIGNAWRPILWVIAGIGIYIGCANYLNKHFYIGAFKQKDNITIHSYNYLDRMGNIGVIMNMSLKMMTRTPKLKISLLCLPLLAACGLMYVFDDNMVTVNFFDHVFYSVSIGCLIMNYNFSYHGNFFELLMTHNISVTKYVQAHLCSMYILGTITLICFMPYFIMHKPTVTLNIISAGLISLGYTPAILFKNSLRHAKRIPFTGNAYNTKQNSKNWILLVLLSVVPILLMLLFFILTDEITATYIISGIGIIGLMGLPWQIKSCIKCFYEYKYTILQNFRTIA